MNRKLKKFANKQLKRYQNEDFLNELKAKQKESRMDSKRKNFIPVCLSTGSAIVMLAVALLCVFLIEPPVIPADNGSGRDSTEQTEPKGEGGEKNYSEMIELAEDSSLEELNGWLHYFAFCGDDLIVSKRLDCNNKEMLRYEVSCSDEEGLSTIQFMIYPDPRTESFEDIADRQGVVASHTVIYHEGLEVEDDIYFFTDKGIIKTDKETILINADIVRFEEDSGFIEWINEIILAK